MTSPLAIWDIRKHNRCVCQQLWKSAWRKRVFFNRLMTTETNLMGLTQSQNKTTIGRAKRKVTENGQVQQKTLKITTITKTTALITTLLLLNKNKCVGPQQKCPVFKIWGQEIVKRSTGVWENPPYLSTSLKAKLTASHALFCPKISFP